MSLKSQFKHLDQFLTNHRHLWQLQAFHCQTLPFSDATNKALATAYQAGKKSTGEFLTSARPSISFAPNPKPLIFSERQKRHISEQKHQQIAAIAAWQNNGVPAVEWCSGLGHLSKLLAQSLNKPMLAIEYQQTLVTKGQQQAKALELPVTFLQADVLTLGVNAISQNYPEAIALHACGDLHQRLIKQSQHFQKLSIVPCCYHLTQEAVYQPLSKAGKQSALQLSRADLSLCLQETVTACKKMPKLNDQQVMWRLAFDELQRDIRAVNEYLPLPSIKKSQLNGTFAAFIGWALEKKGLKKPAHIDYAFYLQQGEKRLKTTRQIEWLQSAFKREIELWLLHDKALYLQEQGFAVELFECFEKSVSPRNIMLVAHKL